MWCWCVGVCVRWCVWWCVVWCWCWCVVLVCGVGVSVGVACVCVCLFVCACVCVCVRVCVWCASCILGYVWTGHEQGQQEHKFVKKFSRTPAWVDPLVMLARTVYIRYIHDVYIGLARTVYIYGVYTELLAGRSPNTRSYTMHIYASGRTLPIRYCRDVPL